MSTEVPTLRVTEENLRSLGTNNKTNYFLFNEIKLLPYLYYVFHMTFDGSTFNYVITDLLAHELNLDVPDRIYFKKMHQLAL